MKFKLIEQEKKSNFLQFQLLKEQNKKRGMLKLSLLVGLAFSVKAYKPHKCPQDFIWTEKGCIRDCKSSKFDDCPDYFTLQFQPNFCALNEDGSWKEYTYQCQACSSPGNIGVTKGSCQTIKERQNHDNNLQKIKCPIYRPNQDNCPTLHYFAPQLKFCGIGYDKKKQGFDLACSACKEKSIQFYYETSCDKLGNQFAVLSPEPVKGAKKPQTSVEQIQQGPEHEAGFCFDDTCCKSHQFCMSKKCTDRCAMMRCAGGCERGQCISYNIQRN